MHLIGCLSPFCLVLFLKFCSVLSFRPCFFVFWFWQPPCVCVLGRAALIPFSKPIKLYEAEPWMGQSGWGNRGSVLGEGLKRGQCSIVWILGLLWPSRLIQSFHPLPICDWCPSSCCLGCSFQGGGYVYVPEVSSTVPTPTCFTPRSYAVWSYDFYILLCTCDVSRVLNCEYCTNLISPK